MSFRVYFDMSTELSKPITVQKGTLAKIEEDIHRTEEGLGLEIGQYKDNPPHWKSTEPKEGVSDETYCQIVESHNRFISWLYKHLEACSEKPFFDGEVITPKQSSKFWHGLQTIKVPVKRWSRDYYVARMEEMYEALRGRGEDYSLNSKALTERQAADVICLFGQWLDTHDCRPDVPKGHDYLATSDDGGYYWCEKCGAVTEQDAENCTKRKCPIKEEWGED